jgi:glutaminyl-peptide cyclotransferase
MRVLIALLALLAAGADPSAGRAPAPAFTLVATFPHDRQAFTEGLFWRDGSLYESTGLTGRSTIREVRLSDGKVLRSVSLPPQYFGEGIVDWGNQIVSLTWNTGVGFRWDKASFRKLGEFRYLGEGWGLTRNAREIIMSDGTPVLRFLDSKSLAVRHRLTVTEDGAPLRNLNELEWVKGEILANVWLTDTIVRIDPASGRVIQRIDLSILGTFPNRVEDDTLNGIAWDSARDRLFVTGKNWPRLYEIRLTRRR